MTAEDKLKKERDLLERLVDFGNKFRFTPIVDDDFPFQRDNFDECLREATEYIKNNSPVKTYRQYVQVDGCMGLQEAVVTTIS
jgi:hypothetical protein